MIAIFSCYQLTMMMPILCLASRNWFCSCCSYRTSADEGKYFPSALKTANLRRVMESGACSSMNDRKTCLPVFNALWTRTTCRLYSSIQISQEYSWRGSSFFFFFSFSKINYCFLSSRPPSRTEGRRESLLPRLSFSLVVACLSRSARDGGKIPRRNISPPSVRLFSLPSSFLSLALSFFLFVQTLIKMLIQLVSFDARYNNKTNNAPQRKSIKNTQLNSCPISEIF